MKRILFILTVLLSSSLAQAQQAPIFTDYSNSYATVNPGFAGLSEGVNVMGIFREQWAGFKDADGNKVSPQTLLFSGDIPIKLFRGGVALSVMKDKIGFEDNINVNLGYSYHLDLGPGILGMGLALSLVNRTMDFAKAKPNVSSDPALPVSEQSDMLIDANFGVYWQVPDTYYIGFAVTNLLESKGKALTSNASTSASFVGDRTFYLMAGYEYQFNNPAFILLPSFCLMSDIASTQINVGSKIMYNNKFWLGVNYRYQESIDVLVGIKIKDIKVGYAYDINTMGLAISGSHEVTVSYCFKLNLDKSPRIYRSIRYL